MSPLLLILSGRVRKETKWRRVDDELVAVNWFSSHFQRRLRGGNNFLLIDWVKGGSGRRRGKGGKIRKFYARFSWMWLHSLHSLYYLFHPPFSKIKIVWIFGECLKFLFPKCLTCSKSLGSVLYLVEIFSKKNAIF